MSSDLGYDPAAELQTWMNKVATELIHQQPLISGKAVSLPRDGAATTHTHQDGSVWGGPWCGLHTAGERPVADGKESK